ncbi:hypothetical protein ACHAWF_003396 [Thalassiosira exigua]
MSGHGSSMVRYVDHTYRDFSRFIEEGGALQKHKKSDRNFPARVHEMLSDAANYHAVVWMPHGRAFKVLDKEALVASIFARYSISCTKYESFSRQLNAWGFKRLYQSGPDLGCFYHECFLRGMPDLTCLILRLSPNTNTGKTTPYPAGEPNFYHISQMYPLPPDPATATTNDAASEGGDDAADASSAEISAPADNPPRHRPSSLGDGHGAATSALASYGQREYHHPSSSAIVHPSPSSMPMHPEAANPYYALSHQDAIFDQSRGWGAYGHHGPYSMDCAHPAYGHYGQPQQYPQLLSLHHQSAQPAHIPQAHFHGQLRHHGNGADDMYGSTNTGEANPGEYAAHHEHPRVPSMGPSPR